VIIVSDEVGFGGVSGNALARKFADQLGELNQAVAALAQIVYLVVAGIPTVIKDETTT
jgi:adenosylcobinamide kinase/adenosylcobinamide-phosphate guanylyltransferase